MVWGDRKHYIVKSFSEKEFQKNLIGSWYYRWNDGWCACVEGTEIDGKESAKRKKIAKKNGFAGYGWMVSSIIHRGKIITASECRAGENHGTA